MSQDSRSLKRISTYSEKYLCFLSLEFFEYFVSAPFFILSSLLTADIPFHNKGKMNKFPTLDFIRTLFLCFQHISSRIHQLICSPGQLAIENICGLSIDFSPYFTEKVLETISIFFFGGGGGGLRHLPTSLSSDPNCFSWRRRALDQYSHLPHYTQLSCPN